MTPVPAIKDIISRLENGKDLAESADMYHELAARLVPEEVSNNCKEIPGDSL